MQFITVLCTIDDFSADRYIDRLRNKDAKLYVDGSTVNISKFVDEWLPKPLLFPFLEIVYTDSDTMLFFIDIGKHEYEVFEYSFLTRELSRNGSKFLVTCYERFAQMCGQADVMAMARALRFALLSEVEIENTMIDMIKKS